jgi:hypothetical protein
MSPDIEQWKGNHMIASTRVKARTITKLAAALAVSLIAIGSASPGYSQPAYAPGATHAHRHANGHQDRAVSRAGREAFGMVGQERGQEGFADRNSPEATGGGSLGYNRKLLEY